MVVKTKSIKRKKLVPPIKSSVWTHNITRWTIEHFPANYEQHTFVEPFCGSAEMFFTKTPANEEALNDPHEDLINIYWALRDEPAQFIERLKKIRHSEKTFKTALDKTEFEDYLDKAVNDFILRKMSRGGNKGVYLGSKSASWKTEIADLSVAAERLKSVYIFNKKPLEIIKVFNDKNTLLYVNQHNSGITESVLEDQVQLANTLNHFLGKVIIVDTPSALMNRLYKGWHTKKHKIVSNDKNLVDCIWFNF